MAMLLPMTAFGMPQSPDWRCGNDIGRPRGVRFAIIAGPGHNVTLVHRIEGDGRTIDPADGAQQHQSQLVERRQILTDGQQERRTFGTVRFTAAGGTGRGDGESSVRETEQERVLE